MRQLFDIHTKGVYHNDMTKRLNIVLPIETIRVLNKVAPKGSRSQLISDAVMFYINNQAKNNLALQLRAGAEASAQRDLRIAEDWFVLDSEV